MQNKGVRIKDLETACGSLSRDFQQGLTQLRDTNAYKHLECMMATSRVLSRRRQSLESLIGPALNREPFRACVHMCNTFSSIFKIGKLLDAIL